MSWTYCPECDARFPVPRTARPGDLIRCPECNESLEVISLNPLELESGYGLEDDLLLEEEDEWDWEEEPQEEVLETESDTSAED